MKTPESATDNNVGRIVPENVPETNVGKINGRTPDEIKSGLQHCAIPGADTCVDCPYDDGHVDCAKYKNEDALSYITQLESRLSQVERERDAAVNDLHVLFSENGHACMICDVEKTEAGCVFDCEHQRKWRGVCPENAKEERS